MDGDCLEVVTVPLVIHPRIRKAVRRVAAFTSFAVLAGAGTALASCPVPAVSTPFSQWGDSSSYFTVPGGTFEGSSDHVGWSLTNATLTAGNEPFAVNAASDSQSLTIAAGGSATSPYFCVDSTMPDLRFFAQQASAGTNLQVQALVPTGNGVTVVPVADLADGSMPSWAPTSPITGNGGAIPAGQSMMVALRFVAPASSGSWQIDDIFVDPYRSG
jgi:hypothetical protein